jgi:phosphoglycerate dehydrogenase-like enzyme
LVINVARGATIDQPALVRALHAGQIGGAGLDVSDPEPLPADDALWNAPNVLVSPHFAGSGSPRSVQRLAQGVADNLRRLLAGQPLEHVVSP